MPNNGVYGGGDFLRWQLAAVKKMLLPAPLPVIEAIDKLRVLNQQDAVALEVPKAIRLGPNGGRGIGFN